MVPHPVQRQEWMGTSLFRASWGRQKVWGDRTCRRETRKPSFLLYLPTFFFPLRQCLHACTHSLWEKPSDSPLIEEGRSDREIMMQWGLGEEHWWHCEVRGFTEMVVCMKCIRPKSVLLPANILVATLSSYPQDEVFKSKEWDPEQKWRQQGGTVNTGRFSKLAICTIISVQK